MLANSQQVKFKHILLISCFENGDRPWHLDISYICKHFQTDIVLSIFSRSEFPLCKDIKGPDCATCQEIRESSS